MESTSKFERLFLKMLQEEADGGGMTAGAGGVFGDGPTMHTVYGPNAAAQNISSGDTIEPGDAKIYKPLGKVQTRKGTTGGKKGKKRNKKKNKGVNFATGEENEEEKQKGVDGKACWKGYRRVGTKKKGGKTVDNCVKVEDEDAEKVDKDRMKCNSPRRTSGGSKKFVVKACKDGKEKIVRFGDPNMKIKKSNPKRRKSFRARHKCDQKKDKFSAGYWSCKKW